MEPSQTEKQVVTVLVVEDQAPVLKVVERSLTRAGIEVFSASTPGEGLELLRQHAGRIDLLLTDVVMPQMSGPELAVAARAAVPDLKVMFMSGYSGDAVGAQLDAAGTYTMVEKPFRPAELVSKVRELVGRGEPA